MGSHPGCPQPGLSIATQRIAQVVPDLPTFAVDDGFAYEIPEAMEGIVVGSMVRVPLGPRRIRGYVVSIRSGDVSSLKPIISISGDVPVFDDALLQVMRWAALHYVAPLSVMLGRAAPPNLPRGKGSGVDGDLPSISSPLPAITEAAVSGTHSRPTYLLRGGGYSDDIAGLGGPVLAAGRNVAVVAPTVTEAQALATDLRRTFSGRVLSVSSELPARQATRLWMTAVRCGGAMIVGTPEIVMWPLGSPALWIVVEEGRRAMKAKQTPTLRVHEIVRRRAMVERTAMVLTGAVPTLDAIARGAGVSQAFGRLWPPVELVDRSEDPAAARSLAGKTVQAIRATVRRGGQVFVFVSRLGYAPAFRCVRCRQLRKCPSCGAGTDRGDKCKRCGAVLAACSGCGGRRFEPLGAAIGRVTEELSRHLGEETVGGVGSNRQVLIGSEKDLPNVPPTALSVAVDADSLLMAPHYRAEEDAFRLLARVILTVARGGGRRGLIQTGQPDHRAMAALQSGRPLDYLNDLMVERERDGLPPASELLAVEVTGDPTGPASDLAQLGGNGVQVHGPEEGGGRSRWFLQGQPLHQSRVRLRVMVQKWRDSGLKVRIDADPIDL